MQPCCFFDILFISILITPRALNSTLFPYTTLFRSRFKDEYAAIPEGASTPEFHFYLGNVAFEAVDAEMLFGLIRLLKPRRMYEIVSGFSTLLAADALRRNGMGGCGCRLIAIDPYPSAQ